MTSETAPSLTSLSLLVGVAAGSAVGAVLRHLAAVLQQRWSRGRATTDAALLPWSTMAVNTVGSALLGAVVGAGRAGLLDGVLVAVLGAGVAGGLTTFSTLAVELVAMIRTGRWRTAVWWTGATLALGVGAAAAGFAGAGLLRG